MTRSPACKAANGNSGVARASCRAPGQCHGPLDLVILAVALEETKQSWRRAGVDSAADHLIVTLATTISHIPGEHNAYSLPGRPSNGNGLFNGTCFLSPLRCSNK